MEKSPDIMKVSLRVLTALNEKQSPNPADVETLREYLGEEGPSKLDELACEVIKKALLTRALVRGATKVGGHLTEVTQR